MRKGTFLELRRGSVDVLMGVVAHQTVKTLAERQTIQFLDKRAVPRAAFVRFPPVSGKDHVGIMCRISSRSRYSFAVISMFMANDLSSHPETGNLMIRISDNKGVIKDHCPTLVKFQDTRNTGLTV